MSSKKVLLVDDENELVEVLSLYFEEWGFDVLACASTTEAMKALEKQADYSLIISDYNLPGESGVDLFNMVRDDYDIPFILLTGSIPTGDHFLKTYQEQKGAHYLAKPFEEDDFKKLVFELA